MTGNVICCPGHIRYICRGDDERCHRGGCPVCELYLCTTCGGAEGALTTDCPGRRMTIAELDAVYTMQIDYRRAAGWVEMPNTTAETAGP